MHQPKFLGPIYDISSVPFLRKPLTTNQVNHFLKHLLVGEIMYGGHIVNDLDRLLANTYLDFFMKDELLDEMPLYPYLDATTAANSAGTDANT